MRRTRKEQKDDTRERVRQAAFELFSRDGVDATTTKAVAERAGVAAGTVFVHATDKTDLLCLVVYDLLHDGTERAFATLPRGLDLRASLLHVFGVLARTYVAHEKLAAPFLTAMPAARGPNGQRVHALTFEFVGRLAALVTDAQARGEVPAHVPTLLLAQNVFALYFFSLFAWISGFIDADSIVDNHLRLALDLQLGALPRGESAG
ncbi:MAG: TetR/AcrR family transcriptional regulator [Polyangiaceae bacterium]